MVATLAAVAAVAVALTFLPTGDWIRAARAWLEGLGPWRHAVFVGAYVITALLLFPASAATLVAGALFGLWLGTALVLVAALATAAIAFVVTRHVARDRVEKLLRRHPKFEAVDRAIGHDGFKIVLLMRLSPIVPFSLSNWFFGLTPVAIGPYLLATTIGTIPGTFLYTYLGHLGAVGLGANEGGPGGALQWTVLGAGLVATAAVTVVLTRLAKRELEGRSGRRGGSSRHRRGGAGRMGPRARAHA